MARIIDPNGLSRNLEIIFDTTARTIELVKAGNMTDGGTTLQAVYSFCKEAWREEDDLIKLPFPMEAITEVKFDIINGWDWKNASTIELIRDGGWSKIASNGVPEEQYFGFVTLGMMVDETSDKAYFIQEPNGVVKNTVYTGPVNEPVKVFGNATHGNFDFRSIFQTFLREQGKTYTAASLGEQGVTAIDYTVYKVPLANAVDPKIVVEDSIIESAAPYTNMTINFLRGSRFVPWVSSAVYAENAVVSDGGRWFRAKQESAGSIAPGTDSVNWESFPGERQIGDTWYPYNIIIDGKNAVAEKIYQYTQWANRQSFSVNADTDAYGEVIGQIAPQFLTFLGDTLITGHGVYVSNFDTSDTNRIQFTDTTGSRRLYPFVAAGRVNFNDNLIADPSAKYWMFFANNYGTTEAIIVQDSDGNNISGSVNAHGSISFDFDYDGNTQGGRTPATDADVVVVGIGLRRAQFVSVTGRITREIGLVFTLVSALERNYISGN